MKGQFSESRGRGISFGPTNCRDCSVRIPRQSGLPTCRCCAADADPNNESMGANTPESSGLMPPAPTWAASSTRRFPQLENALLTMPDASEREVALWWMPQGCKWIAQHPLEYPRNRLRKVTGWGTDPVT